MDYDTALNQENTSYNQQPGQSPHPQKPYSGLGMASMILGILGIVTSCCCYIGVILGSLGLIFALLSKTDGQYSTYGKVGLITSIISLALVVLIMVFYYAILGSNVPMIPYDTGFEPLVFNLRILGGSL